MSARPHDSWATHAHQSQVETSPYQQQIRDALRSSPWLAVSLIVHGLIIVLLFNIPWATKSQREELALNASLLEAPPEILPPPLPPDVPDPDDPPDVDLDPVPIDREDDVPVDQVATQETRFDADQMPSVIGVGGGPVGTGGRPYGRGQRGGTKASQKAVDAGLEWLARHQHQDGHWGGETFQLVCDLGECSGHGQATIDVGVTGLALLAFLGASHTPSSRTEYSLHVTRGLRWLKNQQGVEVDGLFGRRTGNHFMYSQALATLAMCEGYGYSNQPIIKPPAQRGVDFIARARNPHGAWRYSFPPTGRDEDNDVSVTGWMVFALKSAKDFGLDVDETALEDAISYIDRMTDPATGRTGYNKRGSWSSREKGDSTQWPPENIECMTAVAMLCRMILQEDKSVDPQDIPELKKGADLLAAKLPKYETGHVDYYYWYYGSYAMYQMSGQYWERWSAAMEKAILRTQSTLKDSCEYGSWDPVVDPWGDVGGRVTSTALCVLCLEVYYRYDRILGSR